MAAGSKAQIPRVIEKLRDNRKVAALTIDKELITGVLLAGGESRRMGGGDKFLLPLGQQTLLQRVISRAAPQVDRLLLNINGDPQKVAGYPLTVIGDITADLGHLGPLAGILTAMRWLQHYQPQCRWLVSFATDTPFFPLDLVASLARAATGENTPLASSRSGGRTHPVFTLWATSLYDDLQTFILRENQRRLHHFFTRHRVTWVDFPSQPVDPFFNINTENDFKIAQKRVFD